MTAPQFVAAFGGVALGCSVQVFMVERLPMLAAAGGVVGAACVLWAWAQPDPIRELSNAVLHEAHRVAVGLHDHASAEALAAELKRREEVARG